MEDNKTKLSTTEGKKGGGEEGKRRGEETLHSKDSGFHIIFLLTL